MIRTVECSSCSASFPVDSRKVPDEGVYARCSACSAVFFVEGSVGAAVAAPAEATAGSGAYAPPSEQTGGGFQVASSVPDFSTDAPEMAAPAPPPPAEPAPAADHADEWVFETEPDFDSSNLNIERLDTVEEGMRLAKEEAPAEPIMAAPVMEPLRAAPLPPPPPPPPPVAPSAQPAAAKPAGFTFGRRDPHEKASRLARVLVSDIITYNPERHQRALDGGTLKQDFEDEIKKSWGEYLDQVGKEIAEGTEYFNQALNDILARGQRIF